MLLFLYEYGCLCLSQVGGHFQAAELAFIIGGSGECKRSKDGACPPAFTHVLVCPFNCSYLCVYLHLFTRAPGLEASFKPCLQWMGPDSLSDTWPGSDPLITKISERLLPVTSGTVASSSHSGHSGDSCPLSWWLFPVVQVWNGTRADVQCRNVFGKSPIIFAA